MGNEPSQSMSAEWSGSIRFGNGVRQVDFFYKPFEIPGRIVSVEEIVRNEIILVVNKVKWYGLRLIICYRRSCGNTQPDARDYEVLKLTDVWGVSKEVLKHTSRTSNTIFKVLNMYATIGLIHVDLTYALFFYISSVLTG